MRFLDAGYVNVMGDHVIKQGLECGWAGIRVPAEYIEVVQTCRLTLTRFKFMKGSFLILFLFFASLGGLIGGFGGMQGVVFLLHEEGRKVVMDGYRFAIFGVRITAGDDGSLFEEGVESPLRYVICVMLSPFTKCTGVSCGGEGALVGGDGPLF